MVGVGIERPGKGNIQATVDTSLYEAFLAVCNIVFSFCKLPPGSFPNALSDKDSRPCCLFQFHGRTERPKGLSQILVSSARHRSCSLHRRLCGYLLLCRSGRDIARIGISKSYCAQGCLWHCVAYCECSIIRYCKHLS